MTTWMKFSLGFNALFLILAGLGIVAYRQEREDRIRLMADLKATSQLIEQYRLEVKQIDKRIEARPAQVTEVKKPILKAKKEPATIEEIAREILRYVPLTEPPQIIPAPLARALVDGPSPILDLPPGGLVFNIDQTQALRQFYLDDALVRIDLKACQEDNSDLKLKAQVLQQENAVLEEQRDKAITAVKGGSFWTKLKRGAKTFGAGVFTGGVLVVVLVAI